MINCPSCFNRLRRKWTRRCARGDVCPCNRSVADLFQLPQRREGSPYLGSSGGWLVSVVCPGSPPPCRLRVAWSQGVGLGPCARPARLPENEWCGGIASSERGGRLAAPRDSGAARRRRAARRSDVSSGGWPLRSAPGIANRHLPHLALRRKEEEEKKKSGWSMAEGPARTTPAHTFRHFLTTSYCPRRFHRHTEESQRAPVSPHVLPRLLCYCFYCNPPPTHTHCRFMTRPSLLCEMNLNLYA